MMVQARIAEEMSLMKGVLKVSKVAQALAGVVAQPIDIRNIRLLFALITNFTIFISWCIV